MRRNLRRLPGWFLREKFEGNYRAIRVKKKEAFMDLRHVVDQVLLNDTKVLVEREREIMSKVLHHLREVGR